MGSIIPQLLLNFYLHSKLLTFSSEQSIQVFSVSKYIDTSDANKIVFVKNIKIQLVVSYSHVKKRRTKQTSSSSWGSRDPTSPSEG